MKKSRYKHTVWKAGRESEDFFHKLKIQEGCEVFKRGWPDFLVINPDGTFEFVEVKVKYNRQTEPISPSQKKMHEALKRIGIEVKVFYYDKTYPTFKPVKKEEPEKFFERVLARVK
jgi:hypothetical protein